MNHPDKTAPSHGDVVIYIKSMLYFQPLLIYYHDHIQSCNIIIKLNNIPITIGAFYAPFRHTIKNNFIIGGDFSAKYNYEGCHANNPHGTVLF